MLVMCFCGMSLHQVSLLLCFPSTESKKLNYNLAQLFLLVIGPSSSSGLTPDHCCGGVKSRILFFKAIYTTDSYVAPKVGNELGIDAALFTGYVRDKL